jgi:DNA repair protein RecO (recombination protein O)
MGSDLFVGNAVGGFETVSHTVTQQPGYVIHTRPYRETSHLVELFTRDFGRVGAVARGMRKLEGKRGGAVQPFRPLLTSWYGKGELKTLTGAEPGGAGWLTGEGLLAGLYVNELLMRLLHRFDPHPHLFDAYTTAVTSLVHLDALESTLRRFERTLLTEIGYGISFVSVDGERLQCGWAYRYDPERGFVGLGDRVSERVEGRDIFDGEELCAIAEDDYASAQVRAAAKRLMRLAFAARLGDRPLNSRKLFH